MKAICIYVISIISIFFVVLIVIPMSPTAVLFVNHGIVLPSPKSIDTVYRFDFREGEDLEIWLYNNKAFNKVISKKYFLKINEDNSVKVREFITKYYENLNVDEKEMFDENVDISSLVNSNNFYYLDIDKNDERTFLLILADVENKKLYFCNTVW